MSGQSGFNLFVNPGDRGFDDGVNIIIMSHDVTKPTKSQINLSVGIV